MALSWRSHPILKPPTDEEMAKMEPEKLIKLWTLYHDAISNSEKDAYRYGFVLDNWNKADELLAAKNEILISGGNRCLAGEQEVYDPVKKKNLRVDQIAEAFHVEAWDEARQRFVVAKAEKPFQKHPARLFLFELSNGQTLSCSEEHLVLTPLGWREAKTLADGSYICGPLYGPLESRQPSSLRFQHETTLGTSQEEWPPDVLRWNQTIQDFRFDCPSCHYSYDGQLPLAAGSGQATFPLRAGALGCIYPYGSSVHLPLDGEFHSRENIQDDRGSKRGYTHFYPQSDLPSIQDALQQRGDPFSDILSHASCTPYKSVLQICEDQHLLTACRQFFAESSQRPHNRESHQQDRQYKLFSYGLNSIGWVRIVKTYFLRNDVVWDFSVPKYHNYVAAGVISHNSSKTSYAARACVKAAINNPKSVIMCFSQNADVSIRQQQSAIYDALPEELKKKVLGTEENVSYSRKNGFSNGSLILPGSLSWIIFKTYAQYLNNDTILEGAELGCRDPKELNIGAWCDEYLIGPELLSTLRFRLATRNSKLIITFTPIDGYTEVVRDYLEGAKTIDWKNAELLNNRKVPFIQESRNRNASIIYFHSKDNPFGGYERIAEDLKNRDESEILCRAYGIPTKSKSTQFPNFSLETNVVPYEKIPTKGVTRYMVLDPAGRKNWFMAWIAVDETGTYWVYREWPDVNIGDWAKWHGGKWIGGEGSKGLGYGIRDYVDLIMKMEEGETIFERLIDPRLGAAKYQTQNGASSIIEDLADAGLTFIPAPGLDIEDGLQALQTKMAYNRKQPMDSVNRPHFYISDRCRNIISALQEYTAEGGPDEAHKDPIDVIRYAAIDGIRYVDDKAFKRTGRSSGGY